MSGHLTRPIGRRARGFSLIEVLVTITVVSIALLGVAKMQAASIANTQAARARSLVVLQTGALASAMHGNPAYWGSVTVPATVTLTGSVTPPKTCTSYCGPADMALADENAFQNAMYAVSPTYSATVTCAPTATPVTCSIAVSWSEKTVAVNSTAAAATAASSTAFYKLLVTP